MKAWWNLDKEGQIRRSEHCFIGSIIIAIISIGLFIWTEVSAQMVIARCTAVTTGQVISVSSRSKYRTQSTLLAHFVVNGKEYSTTGRYKSGYSVADTFSRKPVEIHYDPSDPNTAYAADAPETVLSWIWIATAVIFAVGAPMFKKQAQHIREHGPVMQQNPFK